VTVNSANGAEVWACGSSHNITWTATDNVAVVSVTIEYSINSGAGWNTLASGLANSGSYTWVVPNTPTTQGLVRVTAYDAVPNTAGDVSNAAFTIADQTVPTAMVIAPNGGETLASGSTHSLRWSAADNVAVIAVDLYVSTDNGSSFSLIASAELNDGAYDWLVPSASTAEAIVRVVARDAAGAAAHDESDAAFFIGSSSGTGDLPGTDGRTSVLQNRPNPFNPSTLIGYGLPAAGRATITVYSVRGEVVRRLLDADCPRGYGEVRWDGRDDAGQGVPSGSYFYRLQAGGVTDTKRLVLTK
jgi:hypothetical protein